MFYYNSFNGDNDSYSNGCYSNIDCSGCSVNIDSNGYHYNYGKGCYWRCARPLGALREIR